MLQQANKCWGKTNYIKINSLQELKNVFYNNHLTGRVKNTIKSNQINYTF